ncbi:hypothetical protein [Calothrix sp. UHCC 0171]|uniref:hypothetical protein n=1 Tax=Calothrix sp. UHCC 0171 TaxID=3110245 RepID=UPI002B21B131|nr:hypothetical protein [Calothrix sp. UHCC 0171]MEA5572992.1 hypothetical protein [Calothrix sp. UHCC 0171]
MGRLKIGDLSFCEIANTTEVKGGFFSESTIDLFDFLKQSIIPTFQKESSEEKDDFVDETFRDESGNYYGRRLLSKDGRKRIYSLISNRDGVRTAVSLTTVSS